MWRDKHKIDQRLFSIKPSSRAVIIIFAVGLFISYFIIAGFTSAKHHTSFVPEVSRRSQFSSSEKTKTMELSNQWYKLKISSTGNVQVENLNKELILSNLSYFYEYNNSQIGNKLNNISVNLLNDSVMSITGSVTNDVVVSILLTVCRNRPRMDVKVKTCYLTDRTVIRESLIAEIATPVSEVYLKNSDIDIKPLAREYWVDKQGVKFGKEATSVLIYHTPEISSIQFRSRDNLLYVNLDYSLDHPFIRIPYQEDGGGKWIDISASQYKPGDERSNAFSLYFGLVPEVLPRFMPVPGGYLAGYIFTEHADGGNLHTHRAAYFGSESIMCPEDATGGFCGHQIPVTKSVFLEEFDGALNRQAECCLDERDYLKLLDQLHNLGNDLCLHTPEKENSTRNTMEEAIKLMKERYHSRSWIDHGMYSGNTNREAYSADGLDPSTKSYAGDLWEGYDVKYFWSPAVEAIRFAQPRPSIIQSLLGFKLKTLFTEFWRRYNFLRLYGDGNAFKTMARVMHGSFPMLELNSQRPFMGQSFPTPLYWQNPTYSGQIYSWPTEFDYNGVTRHLDSANAGYELRHLDLLIEKRGVFFNHGYYVRNHERDEILTMRNGELVINPYFDDVLAYMDQKREEGNLLMTTVRDLLDYRLQIEKIVLDYKPDGSIDIVNNNQEEVRGLALTIRSSPESINLKGTEFCVRKFHDDAIIWFNLPAASSVNLTIGKR